MMKTAYGIAQRRRWIRPDAPRWVRPDAARFLVSGTAPASVFPVPGRKFDPNQPHVPAGNPDGGGNVAARDNDLVRDILAKAKQLQWTASPADYQRCLNLCYRILERVSPRWSDRNTWDVHKWMNACLGVDR